MTTVNIGQEGFYWFLAIVEDINDPLQLGRVRARIFQEHDQSIETDQLPWAIMMVPGTSASNAGVGISPTGIALGSYVFGFFIDGNEKQYPVILGTWHTIPEMDVNKHAVSPLARGVPSIHKEPVGPEPANPYAAEYPWNKVIQSISGHAVEMDDTPGAERIHVYHKSGSYVEIDPKGRMVTKVVDGDYEIVVKDKTVYVKGDYHINVDGNISISSKKGIKLDAPGGVVVSQGSMMVQGALGTAQGATGTFTSMTGETIHVQNGIVTNIY